MDRGIDHLVLCVGDLDAARHFYGRLGFTTTPPALHPFGTGNSLVQLRGNFIELLTVADPAKVPEPEPGGFSFGAFNRDFLADGQGMSMLAFASDDARRDQARFAEGGLMTYAPFDFARKAKLPGGGEATVAFSLAYVTDARLPGIAFFVCQQHAPEHFWKPEYQVHANGARAVAEVVMTAPEPEVLVDLFAGRQGAGNVRAGDGRLVVETALGRVVVLGPEALAERYPGDAAPARPRFAGYRVRVEDPGRVEATLTGAGVPFHRTAGALRVGPEDAFGVHVEFAAEGVP